jgi:transcriptional regulator with XRE-family HTH domain
VKLERKSENIYFLARIQAGFKTRAEAAERLDISYDSLADYETGITAPSEDMVFEMAELYRDRTLIIDHFLQTRTGKYMRQEFGIGERAGELPMAAIGFISPALGVEDVIKKITEIVKDKVVSRDELSAARAVKKELRELTGQGCRLLLELDVAEANLQKTSGKTKTALPSGSQRKLKYAI